MSIFRRRASNDAPEADGPEPDQADEAETAGDPEKVAPEPRPSYDRTDGPYDTTEVDGAGDRLDLGSLWVTGVEGMELRLEVDQEQDAVVAATAVLGDSAVQLQAFAAPKSGGLWGEIRDEIAQSIVRQNGTVQERQGPLGTELSTRMPSSGGQGGKQVLTSARFVGIDGPRWFLRAVFSGKAATDDDAAAPLLDFVRSAVVVRGDSPMAPRELLPLAVPTPADEQGAVDGEPDEPVSLDPFERGPEITEVR